MRIFEPNRLRVWQIVVHRELTLYFKGVIALEFYRQEQERDKARRVTLLGPF